VEKLLRNLIIFAILFVAICIFLSNYIRGKNPVSTPFLYEPVQINLSHEQKIERILYRQYKDWYFTVTPQAFFKIHARVLSKILYHLGIDAKMRPYDLTLSWGEIAKKENYSKIRISQSMRRTYFHKNNSPYDWIFVTEHLSNFHIAFPQKNILQELHKVRKHDNIYMEGFLVDLDGGGNNDATVSGETSLSRTDQGDGACETIYITKLITKNGIFE
jgi:hypothetical protein